MLDVLNSKSPNIQVKKDTSKIQIEITSSPDLELQLNWNQVTIDNVEIIIKGNQIIRILECGEPKNKSIKYRLKEEANLNLAIFSYQISDKFNYQFDLESKSHLEINYADFTTGNKTATLSVNLLESNSSCNMKVVSLASKEDAKLFNINFHHLSPLTSAKMENFGVCLDKSKMSFLGCATIHELCKKSKTYQSAKIALFDRECKAEADPQLCIYENDVDAAHSASVGQINEDHIFYLMSRGLSEDEAKRLITLGYLNPIITAFKEPEIIGILNNRIKEKV